MLLFPKNSKTKKTKNNQQPKNKKKKVLTSDRPTVGLYVFIFIDYPSTLAHIQVKTGGGGVWVGMGGGVRFATKNFSQEDSSEDEGVWRKLVKGSKIRNLLSCI